MKIMSKDH